jgi:hypothetical protein
MHFHTAVVESGGAASTLTRHSTKAAAREEYADTLDALAPLGFAMVECATTPSGRMTIARLYRDLDGARITLTRYVCELTGCEPAAVAS